MFSNRAISIKIFVFIFFSYFLICRLLTAIINPSAETDCSTLCFSNIVKLLEIRKFIQGICKFPCVDKTKNPILFKTLIEPINILPSAP